MPRERRWRGRRRSSEGPRREHLRRGRCRSRSRLGVVRVRLVRNKPDVVRLANTRTRPCPRCSPPGPDRTRANLMSCCGDRQGHTRQPSGTTTSQLSDRAARHRGAVLDVILGQKLSVDEDVAVSKGDLFAGQPDDSLDVGLVRAGRWIEDDDVAALRRIKWVVPIVHRRRQTA